MPAGRTGGVGTGGGRELCLPNVFPALTKSEVIQDQIHAHPWREGADHSLHFSFHMVTTATGHSLTHKHDRNRIIMKEARGWAGGGGGGEWVGREEGAWSVT